MAATPFVVDKESIRTLLAISSLEGQMQEHSDHDRKMYLPVTSRSLWKIAAEVGKLSAPWSESYFKMSLLQLERVTIFDTTSTSIERLDIYSVNNSSSSLNL